MNAQGGAVASLFKLCLDSFGVVMNWVPVHQQGALKEERHRLALWKESFDNDLDQLLESNEADRLKNMVLLFLGSVANSLNKYALTILNWQRHQRVQDWAESHRQNTRIDVASPEHASLPEVKDQKHSLVAPEFAPYPPPPVAKLVAGKPFTCNICFKQTIFISDMVNYATQWKTHVRRDLQPYSCIYPSCPSLDNTTFASLHEWQKHDVQHGHHHHRAVGVWTCVDGCEQVFRERHAFETHILKEHLQANLRLNTDDIKDAVDSCEQQEDLLASRQWTCEFCGRLIEGTRALLRLHVGQHMVSIALKVLPQDCLEDEELDEGYADEPSGVSLNSLASTVNQFAYKNGRRYHSYFGEDRDPMPNDEREQDRLDYHHKVMSSLLEGKLHLAPLETPYRIVDIGTGTGIWAIDMADMYPGTDVIGNDLSPIQPKRIPPNCKFEVDDAEKELTYGGNCIDFIHARDVAQAVGNWSHLMSEIFRCTKPGGYAELAEIGFELHSDDDTCGENLKRWFDLCNDALNKLGRPQPTGPMLKERLENAGFIDVVVSSFKQPYGPWQKDQRLKMIGAMVMMMADDPMSLLEAYGMVLLTRVLGKDVKEATKICNDGVKDIKNRNHHMYNFFHVAYGRKPDDLLHF